MKGYVLLADGLRLDGELRAASETAVGWLAANTGVVGFQEMTTDPAYKGRILAFTYPEVGNVGVTAEFAESGRVQVGAVVVKVLAQTMSHYRAEGSLEDALLQAGVPCLEGIDTRWLAVHLREHGEIPAAVAPADADADQLLEQLKSLSRPAFCATDLAGLGGQTSGPRVAVLNLGMRRSDLAQLERVCAPVVFAHDAAAEEIQEIAPDGVIVSDGPSCGVPPEQAVATVAELLGEFPVLGLGLGCVALGMAVGCTPDYLTRGHHGANCPVRDLESGKVQVTLQRHTVVLNRQSVQDSAQAELLWENINDGSVEGIRIPEMRAVGLQPVAAAPNPAEVNAQVRRFVEGLRDV